MTKTISNVGFASKIIVFFSLSRHLVFSSFLSVISYMYSFACVHSHTAKSMAMMYLYLPCDAFASALFRKKPGGRAVVPVVTRVHRRVQSVHSEHETSPEKWLFGRRR